MKRKHVHFFNLLNFFFSLSRRPFSNWSFYYFGYFGSRFLLKHHLRAVPYSSSRLHRVFRTRNREKKNKALWNKRRPTYIEQGRGKIRQDGLGVEPELFSEDDNEKPQELTKKQTVKWKQPLLSSEEGEGQGEDR